MVVDAGDRVAVVVPMYNEEAVIAAVVTELRTSFPVVVCVDDGSSDASRALASAAGARVVPHPVNLGQGAALETGIRYARTVLDVDHVVTFDADGQHRVADAVAMVDLARRTGVEVVLGSRFLGTDVHASSARRVLLRAAALFSRLTTGLRVTDAHNGLRVLHRDAADKVRLRMHGMSHASEFLVLAARHELTYLEHPVTVEYTAYSRGKGQRGYNALNIVFDLMVDRLKAAS